MAAASQKTTPPPPVKARSPQPTHGEARTRRVVVRVPHDVHRVYAVRVAVRGGETRLFNRNARVNSRMP